MAKKQAEPKLSDLSEDELAVLRAGYDAQIQALREKKLAIQREIDRRRLYTPKVTTYKITDAGNIESQEQVNGLA